MVGFKDWVDLQILSFILFNEEKTPLLIIDSLSWNYHHTCLKMISLALKYPGSKHHPMKIILRRGLQEGSRRVNMAIMIQYLVHLFRLSWSSSTLETSNKVRYPGIRYFNARKTPCIILRC